MKSKPRITPKTVLLCSTVACLLLNGSASAQPADRFFGIAKARPDTYRVLIYADLNRDGRVSSTDKEDSGAIKQQPPGLTLSRGSLEPFRVYMKPRRPREIKDVAGVLEIRGINRANSSGRFTSFEEEQSMLGRVRVWSDKNKSQLLLDSANPDLRKARLPVMVWNSATEYYVEGVSAGGAEGSFQLIAYGLKENATNQYTGGADYLLLTVR